MKTGNARVTANFKEVCMKKTLFVIAFVCAALGAVFAQEVSVTPVGEVLNVRSYASNFGFQNGEINIRSRYILSIPKEERDVFATLQGRETIIDTPLEFSLLSYYSPVVIEDATIRTNVDAILPRSNPREAGLKLGAAVYKELVELRFLDPRNTAAIGRYEGMLKFISDKNGVSRADIETYYRNGIRGLIAEVVDEEFGNIEEEAKKEKRLTPFPPAFVNEVKQALVTFYTTLNQANFDRINNLYKAVLLRERWADSGIGYTFASSRGASDPDAVKYLREVQSYGSQIRAITRNIRISAETDANSNYAIDFGSDLSQAGKQGYRNILSALNRELLDKLVE
jgi:hypothetical protein